MQYIFKKMYAPSRLRQNAVVKVDSKSFYFSGFHYAHYSPEVNGQIFAFIVPTGRKHEIWHKDVFMGGEFKTIRNHSKIDVRTISGGTFVFCPYVCLKR